MNLTFREDYWNDEELKRELIRFIDQIHGLDLTLWNKMGYWDRQYRPFSYFDGDRVISSVCIYSLDMMVDGKPSRVAQVSAVGTLPEYRRKGLNMELSQRAMKWAEADHDFFFLFADEEAFPFYERGGFRMVDEYKPRIEVKGKIPLSGTRKLYFTKATDSKLIERIASERTPVSNKLGVVNEKLFMFWCLYFLKDCIFHVPKLDILVLCKRTGNILTVYDIVGKRMPPFSEVYRYISDATDRTVEFMFMTDKLGLDGVEYAKVEGNGTHLFGDFPLEGSRFIFPCTSHA